MKINKFKAISLKSGEHLGIVRSKFLGINYIHHGIYMGGNKIVQFEPYGVRITTTKEFFKGKELYLFEHSNDKSMDGINVA